MVCGSMECDKMWSLARKALVMVWVRVQSEVQQQTHHYIVEPFLIEFCRHYPSGTFTQTCRYQWRKKGKGYGMSMRNE